MSAFSSGPPDARTGAPGELTCRACHASFQLNSGPGDLTLSLPESFQPGEVYEIQVHLSQLGQQRWGFELTVLSEFDEMAGALESIDGETQISTSLGREYVKHTTAGTAAGSSGGHTWSFEWTAPEGVDEAYFYVAGNAANNNGFNTGDYIYTRVASVPVPEPGGAAAWLALALGLAAVRRGRIRRPRASLARRRADVAIWSRVQPIVG